MSSDDTKNPDDVQHDEVISLERPTLFQVDPLLDAIFIFCTDNANIFDIYDTAMVKAYRKYWESQPIAIVFVMTSSLTSDILSKFCDILELFKENVTTISIRIWFDLFMHHIEHHEVEAFLHKIRDCVESHSLWRLRFIIKYKHCDTDIKWHELVHKLIVSCMMLQFNIHNKNITFRRTATLRLSIRITDYILFWKLQPDKYTQFIDTLKKSTSISHLKIEFGSLYNIHSNYSYIISNFFDAISQNISISAVGLESCADDTDLGNSNGIINEDLTSLLSNSYDGGDNKADVEQDESAYLSYIYNCFKRKKIDVKYSGNNACWKQQSYKFSSSEKDFLLRINSKYNIKNVLNAIQQNNNLCLNCLVLENVIYDHQENEQNWDDPFGNKPKAIILDKHNVWNELLDICTSDRHFIEILKFEESKIGRTYCEDLQQFFNAIIHGNKFNNNNKQCHIKKLEMKTISSHATDVFIEYMTDLMKYGLSYNPMLAEIKVEFDYIGNLKIFNTKISKLIDASLFRITAMIESQFAIEQYLKDVMGLSFGIIQLVLQLTRFHKIKFQINEGQSKFFVGDTAQKIEYSRKYIKDRMKEEFVMFDDRYYERNISKYLMWQYKDTLDDDKEATYTPSMDGDLMSKYMKLICAGDVSLEIGYHNIVSL